MPVAESLDALLGLFRGLKNRLQDLHKGQPMWLTGQGFAVDYRLYDATIV